MVFEGLAPLQWCLKGWRHYNGVWRVGATTMVFEGLAPLQWCLEGWRHYNGVWRVGATTMVFEGLAPLQWCLEGWRHYNGVGRVGATLRKHAVPSFQNIRRPNELSGPHYGDFFIIF